MLEMTEGSDLAKGLFYLAICRTLCLRLVSSVEAKAPKRKLGGLLLPHMLLLPPFRKQRVLTIHLSRSFLPSTGPTGKDAPPVVTGPLALTASRQRHRTGLDWTGLGSKGPCCICLSCIRGERECVSSRCVFGSRRANRRSCARSKFRLPASWAPYQIRLPAASSYQIISRQGCLTGAGKTRHPACRASQGFVDNYPASSRSFLSDLPLLSSRQPTDNVVLKLSGIAITQD